MDNPITFDDIKDLKRSDVNQLLGGQVADGLLSKPDGWSLMDQHYQYNLPEARIARLEKRVAELESR